MIHAQSERADGPFMPVNVAAIPGELVESTLFGHEKGSFTGAVRQQLGKFELADGGTLFLDEIGELKPDLQAKLLRALQESEIERVGGGRPIKVDLRVIAATNVDLEKAVQRGPVPRGPLLPPPRDPDEGAAAARARRGSAGTRRVLRRPLQREVPQADPRHRRVDHGGAAGLPVARQRPRAREPRRAPRRGERQGLDRRRRPARTSTTSRGSRAPSRSPKASSTRRARCSSATSS